MEHPAHRRPSIRSNPSDRNCSDLIWRFYRCIFSQRISAFPKRVLCVSHGISREPDYLGALFGASRTSDITALDSNARSNDAHKLTDNHLHSRCAAATHVDSRICERRGIALRRTVSGAERGIVRALGAVSSTVLSTELALVEFLGAPFGRESVERLRVYGRRAFET